MQPCKSTIPHAHENSLAIDTRRHELGIDWTNRLGRSSTPYDRGYSSNFSNVRHDVPAVDFVCALDLARRNLFAQQFDSFRAAGRFAD